MVPKSHLRPGSWYINLRCDCGEMLVLFADLTNGKGKLQGSFVITCPVCDKRGSHMYG